MDIDLFRSQYITSEFGPVSKGEHADVVIRLNSRSAMDAIGGVNTHIDALLSQTPEDRVGSAT